MVVEDRHRRVTAMRVEAGAVALQAPGVKMIAMVLRRVAPRVAVAVELERLLKRVERLADTIPVSVEAA